MDSSNTFAAYEKIADGINDNRRANVDFDKITEHANTTHHEYMAAARGMLDAASANATGIVAAINSSCDESNDLLKAADIAPPGSISSEITFLSSSQAEAELAVLPPGSTITEITRSSMSSILELERTKSHADSAIRTLQQKHKLLLDIRERLEKRRRFYRGLSPIILLFAIIVLFLTIAFLRGKQPIGDVTVTQVTDVATEAPEGTATALAQMLNATALALDPSSLRIFGPIAGLLEKTEGNSLGVIYASVDVTNFICEVKFYNSGKPQWDYAVFFRDRTASQQFRLIVGADRRWSLFWGPREIVESGYIPYLDTSADGSNYLTLIVENGILSFSVSGFSVDTSVDISEHTVSGNIGVAADIYSADALESDITRFDNFAIWSLP